MPAQEHVVLLDERGTPIATRDKAAVHTADTPLHLAFSCYLIDSGSVLLTRRALGKQTWPGVWTNSFCGHPTPGEGVEDAVRRRAHHELGTGVADLRVVLPDFRYRAVDASGIVENEVCPVFVAGLAGDLRPNPHEVAELRWVGLEALQRAVSSAPFAFSPWLVLQLPELLGVGTLDGERVA